MTKFIRVKMVSNQADMPRDVLKHVNLVPLAGAMSQLWQFFGFKTEKGNVLEPLQVSFNINLSLRVCMQTMAHLHL